MTHRKYFCRIPLEYHGVRCRPTSPLKYSRMSLSSGVEPSSAEDRNFPGALKGGMTRSFPGVKQAWPLYSSRQSISFVGPWSQGVGSEDTSGLTIGCTW